RRCRRSLRTRLGAWLKRPPCRYFGILALTSQISPPRGSAEASAIVALPPRRDLTSLPVSARPASKGSPVWYVNRGLRLWAVTVNRTLAAGLGGHPGSRGSGAENGPP